MWCWGATEVIAGRGLRKGKAIMTKLDENRIVR